jgi:hypothetical protein
MMKSKIMFIAAAVVIIIFVVLGAVWGIQVWKKNEEMKIKETKDTRLMTSLLDINMGLLEASTEQPFLDSMAQGDDIFDTINRWEGVEKKQKQEAYFLKEDIEKLQSECNEDCVISSEITDLKRAIETKIKAYDQSEVYEQNQMNGLSGEMAWKNFWHLVNDLPIQKIGENNDGEITKFVNRYYNIAVVDLVDLKKWCKKVAPTYSDFARFEMNCDDDLDKNILNLSSKVISRDFDASALIVMVNGCLFEQRLRGIPDSADEKCPLGIEKNKETREKIDNYLNDSVSLISSSSSISSMPKISTAPAEKSSSSSSTSKSSFPPDPIPGLSDVCVKLYGMYARYDAKTGECDCRSPYVIKNGVCAR